jgi:hypothetical protein
MGFKDKTYGLNPLVVNYILINDLFLNFHYYMNLVKTSRYKEAYPYVHLNWIFNIIYTLLLVSHIINYIYPYN